MTEQTKTPKKQRPPLFQCMECGKKFYSTKSAERATWEGCRCGGTDIDIYVPRRR